ncbi:MAG: DUF4387 domain-containing protein [Gammaproteobacteria bacterium]|nr:DUF4387 domain-containing protein [Gammaproteobacteria bacterium]
MSTVGERVARIRSKNAGPFWITVDVFCGDVDVCNEMEALLSTGRIAALYRQPVESFKRFVIPSLSVIKFSFPRPVVQGSRFDRDMHGAQWAVLLSEMSLPDS